MLPRHCEERTLCFCHCEEGYSPTRQSFTQRRYIAGSSNGRIADSESVHIGSNPVPAAFIYTVRCIADVLGVSIDKIFKIDMSNKIFAIMTDFSFDFAVASMKALILKDFSTAQIVDIDHSIKQFSILSGAFVINKVYEYFPDQTIFICVVDPGVGSKRELICLDTENYKFVGPNNGLFHYLLKDPKLFYKSYAIKEKFKPINSNTFHGRDLLTPAAIELAKDNLDILEPIDKDNLVFISVLDSMVPVITYIDGFGNIKTNISVSDDFDRRDFLRMNINNTIYLIRVVNTFSDVTKGELLCYRGSNDTLEIAANFASAKNILKVNIGDRVAIEK